MFRRFALPLLWLALLVRALPAAAGEGVPHPPPAQRPAFARDGMTIMAQDGGQHRLWVEIARTPDEMAYGLMNLRELPDTDGMLFIAPRPRPMLFWMKNTLLPLDLLFIDAKGQILNIAAEASPLSERYIPSHGLAKGVLEIPGGSAARWGLRPGDRVVYRDFGPEPPQR